ncbi:MAG: histidinol-phosphate transaminase [Bacteroidota bacterium]|nr:histidinol-phosphate transaminase [Bacteroidota bacterium]MDE2835723.1 histidinol-phosphate transaminase [Bacteroidota bacterium]
MSVNRLQRAVEHVRPAVRHQHAYLVGGEKAPVPIKLNQNESPLDLPEDLKAEILQGWASIAANRYPAEQPADLCDAIAEYAGWVPEGIMAGNGSNELTYLIGMACVEAGTRVVLPTPMFAFYEKVVRLYGGQVISAESDDELRFDAQRIAKLTRQHQPALVVLVSPNNPTGMAMTSTDITAVAEAAPGLVLVDEAYVEFSGQPSAQALLSAFPHLILLRTFSKALGLAGIRLGYLLGHPALMRELLKARVPFMVDRFSQHMALTVLRRPRLLQERIQLMKSGTRHLYQTLCEMPGFRVLPTEANFVTFRPPQDAGVLMRAFLEQGIIVRNMSGYRELDGFLRVNSGTPEENRAFIQALQDVRA